MTTAEPTLAPKFEKLSLPLKVGWGLGSVGTQIVLNTQSLLLLYYFTAILGLEPAMSGTILFAAKIFDACLAPIVGSVSDRIKTPWGRRRPFLVAGAVLCAVGLFFVFNTPTANPLILLLALMVISLGYSFFNIPYIAMPAEMTDSPVERTSIVSWRIACVGLGTMIATSLLPLLITQWGGDKPAYGLVGTVAAVLTLITMLITFLLTKTARGTVSLGEKFSVGAMVGAIVTNKPFAYLLLAKLLQLIGLAATSASLLFFFNEVIGGGGGMLALFALILNGVSMASMLIWPAIGRLFGKVTIYAVSVIGYALFGVSWLFAGPETETMGVVIRSIAGGLFVGGLSLMGQSLLPDTISVDHVRTGFRREGLFAGAYSFVEKASFAVGPILVGLIFQVMGFATHGSAGGDPRAVYIAIGVLTPAAYLLSVLPLWGLGVSLTAYNRSQQT